MELPVLALTMGDAAGVGPEITAKALSSQLIGEACKPVVVGDLRSMQNNEKYLPQGWRFIRVNSPEEIATPPVKGTIPVFQPIADLEGVSPGVLSAEAGRGAAAYVYGAVDLARKGLVQGIVTAPLNKAALHLGGDNHPGHTELLAEAFGVKNFSMVLAAEGCYVFHVTTHQSMRSAIDSITVDMVFRKITLAALLAEALGIPKEVIAVAGINPHAGEGGLFGDEEIRVIAPAVEQARKLGIPVEGPIPADVLFPRMVRGQYHFAIAMYHDQGHAVFKSLYFDKGVNITAGLPVIRTSVDHGTAFDIAGKGIAKEESMIEAILLAAKLGPRWAELSRKAQA